MARSGLSSASVPTNLLIKKNAGRNVPLEVILQMAFVNTRDTIGDQATVDGLVEHSLTELKEDGIGIVETYACYYNTGLQSLELPGVSQIKANAFDACSNLEVVKLGGEGSSNSLSIAANAFNACSKLKHLIVDRPAKASLAAVSGLAGTPIARGEGAVYVPNDLLSTYKSDNVWKNFFIVDKTKYPLSVFDSLADYSWTDILTNSDYATAYAVKDTKTMELTDGTKIKMDLAALDTDVKSDNSGNAKMTWICHGVPYTSKMHSTADTSGGWITRDVIYSFLQGILDKIPSEIKSHIVPVKKTYRVKTPTDETLSSDELIWLLSYKEVGFIDSSYIESDGVTYPTLFPSGTGTAAKNARIKYNTSGSALYWWLRSAYSSSNFSCVFNGGGALSSGAGNAYGVVFGFCTD